MLAFFASPRCQLYLGRVIGYEKAAKIAKLAIATGRPIAEVAEDLGIMSRAQMQALLVADKLTTPGALTAVI